MDDQNVEKSANTLNTSENTGTESRVDTTPIVERVEQISRKPSEQARIAQKIGATIQTKDEKRGWFGNFYHTGSGVVHLPSVEVQRQRVSASLVKEEKRLLRKAHKMQRSSQFSAYQMERIVERIRAIQRVLSDILALAIEQIEQLYRRYVLKQA